MDLLVTLLSDLGLHVGSECDLTLTAFCPAKPRNVDFATFVQEAMSPIYFLLLSGVH